MKVIKILVGTIASVLLGFLLAGAVDLDDIKFEKNIKKLKSEKWFKELSDNGNFYDAIYQNKKIRTYLLQNKVIEKIKNDDQAKAHFLSLIKEGAK